jgi:voltage-gated potassium channel
MMRRCAAGRDARADLSNRRPEPTGRFARAVREARRPKPIERRMARFMREPPSIRRAAGVIVTATALIVVGSGVLIRVLDHSEYSSIWVGMWWALQTVTTVGYGDVTPKHPSGRAVGVVVMLEGIAFLAITTAVITSSFVARAEREQAVAEEVVDLALEARLEQRLDELAARFDRLESMLRDLRAG